MAEILKIEYTGSRASVSLDTGEEFPLPFESVSLLRLSAGKNLDKEEYHQLREESERYACRQKAFAYLAIRSRSASEIRNYLRKKNFPADSISETISGLTDSGYIDDYAFSLKFIQYKTGRKAVGRNLLVKELYAKGIDKSVINRVLRETNSATDDLESATQAARKKLHTLKSKKNKLQRVSGFLFQRGFDSAVIRRVLEALKKEGLKD